METMWRPSMSRRALGRFYEQLGVLLNAGLPVGRAFASLGEQAPHRRLRRFCDESADAVAAGRSLSDIFNEHARLFGSVAVQLIAAADAAGRLPETLGALAVRETKASQLRRRFLSGLIYPIVLVHAAIFVLPVVYVVVGGGGAGRYAWCVGVILVPLYVATGAAYALWRWSRRLPGLGSAMDTVAVYLPYFGRLVRRGAIARFCRTYAILLAAGLPVGRALELGARAAGNWPIRRILESAIAGIGRGRSLSELLADSRLFPRTLVEMLRTGEQTGELPQMLDRGADIYEQELDSSLGRLSVLLPLLVYLAVAAAIGYVIIRSYFHIYTTWLGAGQ